MHVDIFMDKHKEINSQNEKNLTQNMAGWKDKNRGKRDRKNPQDFKQKRKRHLDSNMVRIEKEKRKVKIQDIIMNKPLLFHFENRF